MAAMSVSPLLRATPVASSMAIGRPGDGRRAGRARRRPRSEVEDGRGEAFLFREEGRQAGDESRSRGCAQPTGLRSNPPFEKPRRLARQRPAPSKPAAKHGQPRTTALPLLGPLMRPRGRPSEPRAAIRHGETPSLIGRALTNGYRPPPLRDASAGCSPAVSALRHRTV